MISKKTSALKRATAIAMIASAVLLSGCSDPKKFEVAKLTDDQRKELGQKLTADEGQRLAGFMMRTAMSSKELPVGTTVGQALQQQDAWLAEQKAEELKAAELKKKVEAERAAKQAEFSKLLTVVLVSKSDKVEEYEQKFVSLELAYENKGDKDIVGVKGVLKLNDLFGDKIMNVRWTYDQGIPAKQRVMESHAGVKINQFMDDNMKLWNTDSDKLKAVFEVQTIVFKDGTQIDAPV